MSLKAGPPMVEFSPLTRRETFFLFTAPNPELHNLVLTLKLHEVPTPIQ
jgi:hypothetical protein